MYTLRRNDAISEHPHDRRGWRIGRRLVIGTPQRPASQVATPTARTSSAYVEPPSVAAHARFARLATTTHTLRVARSRDAAAMTCSSSASAVRWMPVDIVLKVLRDEQPEQLLNPEAWDAPRP